MTDETPQNFDLGNLPPGVEVNVFTRKGGPLVHRATGVIVDLHIKTTNDPVNTLALLDLLLNSAVETGVYAVYDSAYPLDPGGAHQQDAPRPGRSEELPPARPAAGNARPAATGGTRPAFGNRPGGKQPAAQQPRRQPERPASALDNFFDEALQRRALTASGVMRGKWKKEPEHAHYVFGVSAIKAVATRDGVPGVEFTGAWFDEVNDNWHDMIFTLYNDSGRVGPVQFISDQFPELTDILYEPQTVFSFDVIPLLELEVKTGERKTFYNLIRWLDA